jgi:hypothetical protein
MEGSEENCPFGPDWRKNMASRQAGRQAGIIVSHFQKHGGHEQFLFLVG